MWERLSSGVLGLYRLSANLVSDNTPTSYAVHGRLNESRQFAGLRLLVYNIAVQHRGCYLTGGEERSIYYESCQNSEDSWKAADLVFHLVFESQATAQNFIGQLDTECAKQFEEHAIFNAGACAIEPVSIGVRSLSRVFYSAYVARKKRELEGSITSEERSPDITTVVSDTKEFLLDAKMCLQMIESSPRLAGMGLPAMARCHIEPRVHKFFARHPDNFLFLSQRFHKWFDGESSTSTLVENVPKLAVHYVEGSERQENVCVPDGSVRMKRKLEVDVEWYNDSPPDDMDASIKRPYKKLGSRTWRTHLHVDDAGVAITCLNKRYKETLRAWQIHGFCPPNVTVRPEDVASVVEEVVACTTDTVAGDADDTFVGHYELDAQDIEELKH